MSAPPIKKPDSPLHRYWVDQQQTQQMDLISSATQNPFVAVKRLPRGTSLQSQCDRLIDDFGYRGRLTFEAKQKEAVMEFAHSAANGEVRYRGLLVVFRDLDP